MISIEEGVRSGNRRALGKAITMVESRTKSVRAKATTLLANLLPASGKSIRIGISGTPGVGKSTFIERLGLDLIAKNHRVAVLAIDPSSPISKGSILGDKTRMEKLSCREESFIRPSAAGDTLGGVARSTREALLLCEAAGYDIIIIETVGVGQSEYAVRSMVDAFIFLQLPNAGDELQGIKKGILEVTDFILINKSEGKNQLAAKRAKVDLELALNLIYQKNPGGKPQISLISALEGFGFQEFEDQLFEFVLRRKEAGQFQQLRNTQSVDWYQEEVQRLIFEEIKNNQMINDSYKKQEDSVRRGDLTPIGAANQFVAQLEVKEK